MPLAASGTVCSTCTGFGRQARMAEAHGVLGAGARVPVPLQAITFDRPPPITCSLARVLTWHPSSLLAHSSSSNSSLRSSLIPSGSRPTFQRVGMRVKTSSKHWCRTRRPAPGSQSAARLQTLLRRSGACRTRQMHWTWPPCRWQTPMHPSSWQSASGRLGSKQLLLREFEFVGD